MFGNKKTSMLKSLAVASLFSFALWTPEVNASVNLWWNHVNIADMDQATCVAKANALVSKENAGRITTDADSVRSWSEHLIVVVECMKLDGQTTVMVLVSADKEKVKEGGAVYNKVLEGMKK